MKPKCETQMDTIFNNYCSSVTSVAELAPGYSTTFSLPFSTKAPKSIMNSGACENSSRASASESDGVNLTTTGPIALAVLSCLSVLMLVMVTTGWVCTCLIVKKREANKSYQLKR